MARYTGPKTKIARKFGEANITEMIKPSKKEITRQDNTETTVVVEKNLNMQFQLLEKQKAKYTYGILEKQFRNMFKRATAATRNYRRGTAYNYAESRLR